MKDNKGRVLSLVVEITDPEKAKWIWEREDSVGVKVYAISDGDIFKERDNFAQAASFYIREEGETTEEAVEAHVDDGFETPEEAKSKAGDNVSPGAKWDIVDRRGNVYYSGVAEG